MPIKANPGTRMGAIMPPVDVNQSKLMGELQKRIKKGPITMVFVYADWCGHCQRYKDTYTKLENNPNRNIQIARLRDDMVSSANIANAKIEGYPSIILVDKNNKAMSFKTEDGSASNDVPDHNNVEKMNKIVEGDMSVISREKSGVNEPTVLVNNNSDLSRPVNQNASKEIANALEETAIGSKNVTVPKTEDDSINNASKKYMDSFIEQSNKKPANFVAAPAPRAQAGGDGCGCTGKTWSGGAGGLYGLLTSVASSAATPIALLGSAAYLAKKKTRSHTKKSKAKKTRRNKKH